MTRNALAATQAVAWRNRIVGHADVPPADLVPNPANWRTHPRAQQRALAGALSEVGWVAQGMVNMTTGHVVDGHLRLDLAIARGEPTVPVAYVELSEDEERVVLATLDPIGALAPRRRGQARAIAGRAHGRRYGREVEAGAVTDPTFFFRWWEAPPGLDHRAPATWRGANPALGDFLKIDDFEAAVRTAHQSAFRRFRLNQWVAAEHLWLPAGLWEGQADPSHELDPKLPLAVGIDPAYSDDTFAVVLAQRQGEDTLVRARFWLNPYPIGHSAREDWVVDHEEVRAYLRDLHRAFPVAATRIDGRTRQGPAFVYDPSSFTESAQILEGEGLAMIEMPQTDTRMVPATRLFYDLLLDRRIWHDGDPILASHLRNCHAVERGENGWRLRKATKSSPRKIDGAIAAVMAVSQAAQPVPRRQLRAFLV